MLIWVYIQTHMSQPWKLRAVAPLDRQGDLADGPTQKQANGKQAPALNATGQRETTPQELKNKCLVY